MSLDASTHVIYSQYMTCDGVCPISRNQQCVLVQIGDDLLIRQSLCPAEGTYRHHLKEFFPCEVVGMRHRPILRRPPCLRMF